VAVPLLREVVSWNLVVVLRKKQPYRGGTDEWPTGSRSVDNEPYQARRQPFG
jgi:hypothetical protein